tara:strand:- start:1253 stop:2305 length:1053 start_codon:yes stop_codon:yes gene_type:complete
MNNAELKKIKKNFNQSLKNYDQVYKSGHWQYQINKKTNIFKIENLKNFRNNKLSFGLDDQFYSRKQFLNNFKLLRENCGDKFLEKALFKKNIGNVKNYIKYKNKYFVDMHDIFFVKFLFDLEKNIDFRKIKYICDIGSGYGALASKILKLYSTKKIILIDLPESNLLSAFYLKKLFPKKKFFYSFQLNNKKFQKSDFEKFDIFILNPWDFLPFKKIDLFINTRSMMEMDYKIIKKYFNLIQSNISQNGYFLNINRYYKDTTGYPIEYHKYPYDQKWKIVFSKTSWQQSHVHAMLTQRIKSSSDSVCLEQKKIKSIMQKKIKDDPRFIRRFLPVIIYKIYKFLKKLITTNK